MTHMLMAIGHIMRIHIMYFKDLSECREYPRIIQGEKFSINGVEVTQDPTYHLIFLSQQYEANIHVCIKHCH